MQYLEEALQNYNQYNIIVPITISKKYFVGIVDELLIWKNEYNGIVIGSREEFSEAIERSDSDYRITEDNLIYSTNDSEKIYKIKYILLEYIIYENYEALLKNLIEELKNKKMVLE